MLPLSDSMELNLMSPVQTDLSLILTAISDMKDDVRLDISGIHARLDKLNGRTRELEQSVAVHKNTIRVVGAILLALIPTVIVALFK